MGWGLGDREAENRANDLPSFLGARKGNGHPHLSKVTQTLVRLGKEKAAPPSHAQAPACLSSPRGKETALPSSLPPCLPGRAQAGLQPTDQSGGASIAPNVTRGPCPGARVHREAEVKGRTIILSVHLPSPSRRCRGSVRLGLRFSDAIASYTVSTRPTNPGASNPPQSPFLAPPSCHGHANSPSLPPL